MADPRMTANPYNDVRPDFAISALGRRACDALVSAGDAADRDAAVVILNAEWDRDHADLCARWDAQVAADQQHRDQQAAAEEAEEDRRRTQERLEKEAEVKEREKKKPKLPVLNPDALISSEAGFRVSAAIRKKIRERKYVPLYHFTDRGLVDSARNRHAPQESVLTIFSSDADSSNLQLRPATGSTSSKSEVQDEQLEWRELVVGARRLISAMSREGWPQGLTASLALMFATLESLRADDTTLTDELMFRYAARACAGIGTTS